MIHKKHHLIRFIIGPMVIVAAFLFIEENRPFTEVWKPLALYYGLALPAFFLVDWVKRRKAATKGAA